MFWGELRQRGTPSPCLAVWLLSNLDSLVGQRNCVSALSGCWDKMLDNDNMRERGYVGSQFQGTQSGMTRKAWQHTGVHSVSTVRKWGERRADAHCAVPFYLAQNPSL